MVWPPGQATTGQSGWRCLDIRSPLDRPGHPLDEFQRRKTADTNISSRVIRARNSVAGEVRQEISVHRSGAKCAPVPTRGLAFDMGDAAPMPLLTSSLAT